MMTLVVLCRPAQWREAAIVLSCSPPGQFTPLLVVEPPPVDDEGYRALYQAYVGVRDKRDALVGTAMARQSAMAHEVAALNAATDVAAQALTPFRSWWRHQRSVGEILARRPPRRAVLLFEPAPGELDLIDAVPQSRIGPSRMAVLPAVTERVSLAPELGSLADRAWTVCGRDGTPGTAHGPGEDTPLGWFAALARALETGRVIDSGAPALPGPADPRSSEAVLVEVEADAAGLIGVQYAHERRARLVLTGAPDTRAIADAVGQMSGSSHAKLFGGLRDWWSSLTESPDIALPLKALEEAVNGAVPDAVVEAVDGCSLTAFTREVPYHFVRKCGADWSTKTIGHVAGDPALIVLAELLDVPSSESINFTLLFDTGKFTTSETTDVLHVLQDRPAIPLLLSEDGAAVLNLIRLGELLPLEFLHFNTHGNQREIELADGGLPAWKLFRQGLPSRPFIFNNSCLSWTGVGREFIRAGARGYIGTLWPVDAEQAARLAKTVLERITRQGWPVARAIRETGVDRHTDRAYVFAGTASARLATLADNRSRREALRESIAQVLGALLRSLADNGEGPAGRFIRPMQDLLWTTSDRLLATLDRNWPAPDGKRLDIAADRLSVMARQAEAKRGDAAARAAEIVQAMGLLEGTGVPAAERDRHRAEIRYAAARIALAEGRTQEAIELSTDAASVPELNLLSDALRAVGRIPEALAAAEGALAAVAPGDRAQRLDALGRVGQLVRRAGLKERALTIAREGYALAVELDAIRKRATFKGDETRALLVLHRAEEAVAAARVYRGLARQAYGDLEDLSAAGALVQALTMAMQTHEADTVARQAAVQAGVMGQPRRAAQFVLDRARIAGVEDRLADAVALGLEAASAFAECGAMERVRAALGLTTEFLNQAHKTLLPAWQDLFRTAIQSQAALAPKVTADLRSDIAAQSASQMAKLTAA